MQSLGTLQRKALSSLLEYFAGWPAFTTPLAGRICAVTLSVVLALTPIRTITIADTSEIATILKWVVRPARKSEESTGCLQKFNRFEATLRLHFTLDAGN